ncbi:hypothetical protein OpiT1DRAFT_04866 [Opitutaceae bacterium TAV1]|nr:hypothetical protein OpiT1DRAFT_04866 [Opitutaceae bacterium TAV1]
MNPPRLRSSSPPPDDKFSPFDQPPPEKERPTMLPMVIGLVLIVLASLVIFSS